MFCSETRIFREHDTAMNKLFDWQARFERRLIQTLQMAKEFHAKDRLSEANNYLAQLDELKKKVQEFLEEVIFARVVVMVVVLSGVVVPSGSDSVT